MEQMNLELTFDDFYIAADRLYSSLCISEKNDLLFKLDEKKQFFEEECTFAPKICKNTNKILAKCQNGSVINAKNSNERVGISNTNVNCHIHKNNHHRDCTPDREMNECSFKPKINNYKVKQSYFL